VLLENIDNEVTLSLRSAVELRRVPEPMDTFGVSNQIFMKPHVADLDSDGMMDIFGVFYYDDTLSWYRNGKWASLLVSPQI